MTETPTDSQIIEVSISASFDLLPLDHRYALFSAISRVLPIIHGRSDVGIFPLSGRIMDRRILATNKSCLRLRLPFAIAQQSLKLVGQSLLINGSQVQLGMPQIFPLRPSDTLVSQMVHIRFRRDEKFALDADRYLVGINTGLEKMGVKGNAIVECTRSFNMKGAILTGAKTIVTGLSPEDSITLQAVGIGGKKGCGCGLFVPVRKTVS